MLATSPAPPIPSDRQWTISDIAAFFRVTEATVRGWQRDGRLPAGYKIGRRWLWEPRTVKAHADSLSEQGVKA
jgi:Helix-turn-helix domain